MRELKHRSDQSDEDVKLQLALWIRSMKELGLDKEAPWVYQDLIWKFYRINKKINAEKSSG